MFVCVTCFSSQLLFTPQVRELYQPFVNRLYTLIEERGIAVSPCEHKGTRFLDPPEIESAEPESRRIESPGIESPGIEPSGVRSPEMGPRPEVGPPPEIDSPKRAEIGGVGAAASLRGGARWHAGGGVHPRGTARGAGQHASHGGGEGGVAKHGGGGVGKRRAAQQWMDVRKLRG